MPFALTPVRRRERRVDALAHRLPRVGLAGVLQALDRQALPCDVPGDAARDGLTWDDHDRDDRDWVPQGVVSTGDGDVLLVAWYARRRFGWTPGSRVTVVDRSDPARPRYGHVLLTAPRPLGVLGRVPVHVGGIAVLGGLLYVADTRAGVRVFRLDDVLRVDGPRRGARGHRHVLPQLLRLSAARGRDPLRFSFLWAGDVDGRLSLLVGEYGRKGSAPRLVRYPLDPGTGLPETGPDGRCTPLEVHERQPLRMQGVAVDGGTWFVSASSGEGRPGDLHVGRPGSWTRHRGVLPTGPEDLDRDDTGRLWCATEWPGRRWVFSIDPGAWR